MLTTSPSKATAAEIVREIQDLREQVEEMATRLATADSVEDRQDAKKGIEIAQWWIDRLERELLQPLHDAPEGRAVCGRPGVHARPPATSHPRLK